MRILIEEYQYSVTDEKRRNDLKVILQELGGFENLERKVSVNCVGYYYSTQLKDCVFILPKVLITVTKDKRELVFGEYQPEDIINIDSNTLLSDQQKRFIYEFAVWIYRAIDVYRTKNSKSQIIYYRHIAKVGNGRRRMSNTFLDVLLSLIQFNKDNQNFFFFTLRNQHSGLNKINWTKTISRSKAFINGDGCPVYMNPINKKRCINFDEELLVIFFSKLDDNLSYQDRIEITDKQNTHFTNIQFKNRLFDRDTLLVCHYDVNFLYVVSLYARNNTLQKQAWKSKVRKMFREEIQKMLSSQYNFYAMQAHPNEDAKKYLQKHFQQTLGKVFTPFNNNQIFSLALDKDDPEGNNEELLTELRKHFFIIDNSIGNNPEADIAKVIEKEKIKYVYSETEAESLVLVGCIRSEAQRVWIMNKGKYNIRLNTGKKIDGAITPDRAFMNVNHLLFYQEEDMSIAHYYDIAKENSAPQFAGLSLLKSYRYPFNVKMTPQPTFMKRLEEKYKDRMYLIYEINTNPIPFQNGIKIDLKRLLEAFNDEGTPIGTPFVIPFKDLLMFQT